MFLYIYCWSGMLVFDISICVKIVIHDPEFI